MPYKDPEKKRVADRKYSKKWRGKNPWWFAMAKYGITSEEVSKIHLHQGGKCAIPFCNSESQCIDHDHTTGEIRGLLCSRHNSALASFGDNADSLKLVLSYLISPPVRKVFGVPLYGRGGERLFKPLKNARG